MTSLLTFLKLFLLILLNINIVHSHFHSNKDYDSMSNKCCEIGTQKATDYQKNQTVLLNSVQELCAFGLPNKDLVDVPKELEPQCYSLVKLCCQQTLNKQVCRHSKSIVIKRLDSTAFSLNKEETKNSTIKSSIDLNDTYYQQCLPNPDILRNSRFNSDSKLLTKLSLLSGNQEVYSECCVACKLGLFSALNDFKCIAEKNMKPTKLFEETFYDCCFKLKRSLNLASGKKVDIASMEVLVYPKLQGLLKFDSDLIQKSNSQIDKNGISNNEIVTFQPLIDVESVNVQKKLDQQSKIADNFRTQIIASDNNLPKDLNNLRNTNPISSLNLLTDCPTGMRLDDKNTNNCIDIDECKENSHNCRPDEKCFNLSPSFKCVKSEANSQNKISEQLNTYNQPKLENPSMQKRPHQLQPQIQQPQNQFTNQLSNQFPNIRQPVFNAGMNPFNSINPFMHPNQLENRHQYSQLNQLPPQNYSPRIRQTSPYLMQSKKKLIDKCKIGNHNCDQTQTCRKSGDNFLCVPNAELEEYDRLHPYYDYQPITTTQLPILDISKLRKADLLDQFLPDELVYNPKKLCASGYQLNPTTNDCEDVDECATGMHNCTFDYRCDNLIGSFICVREYSCGTGYTFNMDKKICEDIDECKLNTHHCNKPYKCVNVNGSFRCELNKCRENYRSIDNKCIQVVCSPGFIYNSLSEKCVDLDECTLGISESDLNFLLSNKIEENDSNVIEESNKFERMSNGRYQACKSNQKCENTLGGFNCHDIKKETSKSNRQNGLKYGNEKANILDGKFPSCSPGYELSKLNNITCQKLIECHVLDSSNYATLKNFDVNRTKFCNYKCVKLNNEFSCVCPTGFNSRLDGFKCIDIDECKLNPNICKSTNGEQSFCQNLRGSYKCIDINCPDGYVKDFKNALQCVITEKAKNVFKNSPRYVSYSFISFQSNINLTNDARIASIRGSNELDVEYKLISASSPDADFEPNDLATENDFKLVRNESDHIYLKRSLIGPQEARIEFTYTINQNGKIMIMNKLILTILVSEFNF